MPQNQKKAKPAHEIRFGPVKAVIWANDTSHGLMYNVVLNRLYKDGEGNWKETASLGRDDLLPGAKALDAAHTWITERQREEE